MANVIAVEKSGNTKTGRVSATYVTQSACPKDCKFYGNGCYAESGHMAFVTRRLAESDDSPETISRQEADAIRALTGKLPLRVHVVGDCATDVAASTVAAAMVDHTAKAGQPAWTYTHAWRDVSRASWGPVAIQASCETADDEVNARARGYGTVRVVESFPTTKRYAMDDGSQILPCPQQTGKAADCASCGLCLNPALIESRRVSGVSIGFAAHGVNRRKAIEAIS